MEHKEPPSILNKVVIGSNPSCAQEDNRGVEDSITQVFPLPGTMVPI